MGSNRFNRVYMRVCERKVALNTPTILLTFLITPPPNTHTHTHLHLTNESPGSDLFGAKKHIFKHSLRFVICFRVNLCYCQLLEYVRE